MANRIHAIVVLLTVTLGLSSCGRQATSSLPTAPSAPPAASNPAPSGTQPHISEIVPATSTIAGGAWGTIRGSGFQGVTRLTFGGVALRTYWKDSNTLQFWTVAHEAGTVDVVVRNQGGREETLARGYTFAPPESFDFNGIWDAYSGDEYGTEMQFVVENNMLISVTCGSLPTVTFAAPPIVSRGEFSYVGEDGLKLSGRLVSPINAVGAINVAPCAPAWWADKR